MTETRTIEVDFDIHKLIENERRSFLDSPNQALRRLLGLPEAKHFASATGGATENPDGGKPWIGKGVTLPHGTRVRMQYNSIQYCGEISDGQWLVEENLFGSPSGAASGTAITKDGGKTKLDGWGLWSALRSGDTDWIKIDILRRNARN